MSKYETNDDFELAQLEQKLALSNIYIILNIFYKLIFVTSCILGRLYMRILDIVIACAAITARCAFIIALVAVMLAFAVINNLIQFFSNILHSRHNSVAHTDLITATRTPCSLTEKGRQHVQI